MCFDLDPDPDARSVFVVKGPQHQLQEMLPACTEIVSLQHLRSRRKASWGDDSKPGSSWIHAGPNVVRPLRKKTVRPLLSSLGSLSGLIQRSGSAGFILIKHDM